VDKREAVLLHHMGDKISGQTHRGPGGRKCSFVHVQGERPGPDIVYRVWGVELSYSKARKSQRHLSQRKGSRFVEASERGDGGRHGIALFIRHHLYVMRGISKKQTGRAASGLRESVRR
jgi:hypothetical protein